mgnify:FL=1
MIRPLRELGLCTHVFLGVVYVVFHVNDHASLDARVSKLLKNLDWRPTPIQEAALGPLLSGEDALLVAPTGSGKTEAAIIPLVSNQISEGWEPLSILYVTPLRALNRDMDQRLGPFLDPLNIDVALRHGDTSKKERARQSKSPPDILITTPETAQIMLLGSRLRVHLSKVRAIIVDEIHDLASSERGAQLLIGIQRIRALSKRPVQIVGLSATVGNPKSVASWLSNKTKVIEGPSPRSTEVSVHVEATSPEDEALAVTWNVSPRAVSSLRRLSGLIQRSSPALVFVNSRSNAETVAQRMSMISPEIKIGVHHGSLAAETRRQTEDDLKNGNIDAMICTSSLELGIDVGSIKAVHQLQSPRSVDSLLQRIGRSEHRLGGTGRGEILVWETDDIAESGVISRRALAGDLPPIQWRSNPSVVAANQLMQMAMEKSVVPLSEAHEIIQSASIFDEWTYDDTIGILRLLDDRWLIRLIETPSESDVTVWNRKLWEGLVGRINDKSLPVTRPEADEYAESVLNRIKSKMVRNLPEAISNGWFQPAGKLMSTRLEHYSMIPDEELYKIRDVVSRRILGTVDEAFVLSLNSDGTEEGQGRPRTFVIAGRTWQIIDADPDQSELVVAPISDIGNAPVWSGELPPVPSEVAKEVGQLRRSVIELLNPTEGDLECIPFEEYPLSQEAASMYIQSVVDHQEAAGCLPDDRTLTIEVRQHALVLNCCRGSKINETLAHFIQAMGSGLGGSTGIAVVDPYRISFKIPEVTASHMEGWLMETSPRALEAIMRMTIPNGRAVRARFVQVARRFGILRRDVDPRKVNISGMMRRYDGTPVAEETLSKLFHERMDIPGTMDLMSDIQNGDVRIIVTPPGPLGQSPRSERDMLLPAWSDRDLREKLENRLLSERCIMVCLNCLNVARSRVSRLEDRFGQCAMCGGKMRCCGPERMEKMILGWVKSRDPKDRARVQKNAELLLNHGFNAVMCLMGRGVGEETAARILRDSHNKTRTGLLRSIHNAEIEYARTRRYWS